MGNATKRTDDLVLKKDPQLSAVAPRGRRDHRGPRMSQRKAQWRHGFHISIGYI